MHPDYDITLNSSDGDVSESSKSHFLNSLGLGYRNGSDEAFRGTQEKAEDEGLVLSSLPDDLGFPMVPSEPARGFSFPVTRGPETVDETVPAGTDANDSEPETPGDIPMASLRVEGPSPEGEASVTDCLDPETVLHLACPECEGALVLKRRHLGVEGACVWCHTAIVAAESGRDGAVRIFPILGVRVPTPQGDAAPGSESTPAEAGDSLDGNVSSATTAPERAPMAEATTALSSSPAELNPQEEGLSNHSGLTRIPEDPVASLPFDFSSSAMDFVTETGNDFASTAALPASETEPNPVRGGFVANELPDLEALYRTDGFSAPFGTPAATVPETVPAAAQGLAPSGYAAPSTISLGFGSFLQSAQPVSGAETSAGFAGPTLWGPPARPTEPAPSPAKPMTAPIPGPEDAAPSALPNGFVPSLAPAPAPQAPSWESAFGSPLTTPPAPMAASEPDDTFAAAFSSPFGTGSADQEKRPSPFNAYPTDTTPAFAPTLPSGDLQPGFSLPAALLGDGPPSWADSSPGGGGIFGDLAPQGQLPRIQASVAPSDEAPATLMTTPPEPRFTTGTKPSFSMDGIGASSPFGESGTAPGVSAFPAFRQASALPAAPAFPAFAEEAPLPSSLPAVPGIPAIPPLPQIPQIPPLPGTAPVPAIASSPLVSSEPATQATSVPLGAKPKPKVRKGFVVLVVVLLGFASGAALASYILPVERYVEAARAFMEARFAPKPAEMPALQVSPSGDLQP